MGTARPSVGAGNEASGCGADDAAGRPDAVVAETTRLATTTSGTTGAANLEGALVAAGAGIGADGAVTTGCLLGGAGIVVGAIDATDETGEGNAAWRCGR